MKKAIHITTLSVLLLAPVAVAGGTEGRTIRGETAAFAGTQVTTWARMGANGEIVQVGATIPMAAIERPSAKMEMVQLNFPAEVQRTTFLNHLSLDWMPQGHEPQGRYTTPHFDVHFYTVDKAAVHATDCKDLTQLPMENVPEGWTPAVPPGAPAQAMCAPMMGFHHLPMSEFGGPGQIRAGLFDKVMISGSYQGKMTFLEPMVTRATLMTRQNFSLPVPQPRNLGRETLYPTRFDAVFDKAANAYQFILSDFRTVR